MRAAVLRKIGPVEDRPLAIEDLPDPVPQNNEALLKVLACGVCRTDLHIAEGDLPTRLPGVIPGHEIVAEVVRSPISEFQNGDRVGVSWIGGTDGTCSFCRWGRENLCEAPTFTGYTHHGGYAAYATARVDFLYRVPSRLSPATAAPLLCAGMIGFRSLRIAEVSPGQNVGLFGFGSCAQLMIQVLRAWKCNVYVSTRDERHQKLALEMGAAWAGGADAIPPMRLDAAVTFAPVGEVVVTALRSLRKGAIVAINAIHLDHMPQFDYDSILWGERQIRSVTNMTRQDGRDFLALAESIDLQPQVQTFSLEEANEAMLAQKRDRLQRTAVLLPNG